MANRWRNNGNNSRLYFWGSNIIADDDCNHEIKRRLLFGKKAITNLDSIIISTDITLSTKVHLIKALVLSVVMDRCESWTIKKAERWRIDAFELGCWRRLLRLLCKGIKLVNLKGNQSWIFIGRTDAEAKAPILWPHHVKNWLSWKDPDAGKVWRWEKKRTDREGDGWMASPTRWT